MLGHVAQSVGGALPGATAATGMLAQRVVQDPTSTDITVLQGVFYAFIEAIGQGGTGTYSSTIGSSGNGAAGEDKIIAVNPGDTLTCLANRTQGTTAGTSTVSLNGSNILTALGGLNSSIGAPASTTTLGKYPGERGIQGNGTTTVRAKGGGRLAGPAGLGVMASNQSGVTGGVGSGALPPTSNGSIAGPPGMIVVSFFATYDAALAFANSQYNGAWVPS